MLGIFNLCRQTCPDLGTVLNPLHDVLKVKDLLEGKKLGRMSQEIWEYVLKNQLRVSLKQEVEEFHLKVDWSHLGMGYVLYASDPEKGMMVGVGSKGAKDDRSSSYSGELSGVVGALDDTKKLVQAHRIVLWTGSENVYQRITRKLSDHKKLLDVRVSRMLSWIWANYPCDRLVVKYVPAEYNEGA